MKKYLLGLLTLLVALPTNAFTLPQGAEILTSPEQIKEYTILGQVGKTGEPGSYLYGVKKEIVLGAYNPTTGYQSRTTQYIAASATIIPVVSTKDKAGNQIDLTNISSSGTVKVYLNLAPGTSLEEPIVCTGLTATSWTNCTRGLSFQGSSETASTTLQKAHNAGTPIIMTNIAQFYNQFVATDGDQTVNGNKTFTGTSTFNILPLITTTTPTDPRHAVTLDYLTTVTSTGCANASTAVRGCVEEATTAEAIVSASTTGATGARLYVNPSGLFSALSQHLINKQVSASVSAKQILYSTNVSGLAEVANATNTSEINSIIGVALDSASAFGSTRLQLPGSVIANGTSIFSGGETVYLGDDGFVSTTPGTIRKVIGTAIGLSSWIFNPDVLTPTSTPGSTFTPVMTSASGTIPTTLIATSTGDGLNGNYLRSTSTGPFWGPLNSTGGASTTATRAVDQVYRNTSTEHGGKTLMVMVTANPAGGSGTNGQCTILLDSSSSPTTVYARIYLNNDGGAGVSNSGFFPVPIFVPPGWYWRVTNTSNCSSLNNVYEMEL